MGRPGAEVTTEHFSADLSWFCFDSCRQVTLSEIERLAADFATTAQPIRFCLELHSETCPERSVVFDELRRTHAALQLDSQENRERPGTFSA